MKQKFTALTLLLVLMMVLVACGGAAAPQTGGSSDIATPDIITPDDAETVATEIATTTPEAAEEATVVTGTPEGEVVTGTPAPNLTIVASGTMVPTGTAVATGTTVSTDPVPLATATAVVTKEATVPEGVIMVFKRDGGFAGFCDTMTIMAETAILESCNPNSPQGEMPLDPTTQAQLLDYQSRYATMTLTDTDAPGAADAMTFTIEFYGTGSAQLDDSAKEELLTLGKLMLDNFASMY